MIIIVIPQSRHFQKKKEKGDEWRENGLGVEERGSQNRGKKSQISFKPKRGPKRLVSRPKKKEAARSKKKSRILPDKEREDSCTEGRHSEKRTWEKKNSREKRERKRASKARNYLKRWKNAHLKNWSPDPKHHS